LLQHKQARHPFRKGTKLDRAFVFQLSKLLFKLNQLVQDIQHRFLEKEPISVNQLTHELDNTVMWQHGDTSRKTSRILRTTDMSLSSRGNLNFKQNDLAFKSFGTNLTL
jgi:EAL domain-containing protein (putative c-di-GMP-specific phosphodiesterase class I)